MIRGDKEVIRSDCKRGRSRQRRRDREERES